MKGFSFGLAIICVLHVAFPVFSFPAVQIRHIEPANNLALPVHHGVYIYLKPIKDPNLTAFKVELSGGVEDGWHLYDDKIKPYNTERITLIYRGAHYAFATQRDYQIRVCAIYGTAGEECGVVEVNLPRVGGADTDKDDDGLKEVDEYNYGVDPLNPDSDYDDMSDRVEVAYGLDSSLTELPVLELSENALQFGGGNAYGDLATQHQTLFIGNHGARLLRIFTLTLESDPPDAFKVSDHFREVREIPPGGGLGVSVDFLPQVSGRASGTLTLLSDDRQNFPVKIPLSGQGKNIANLSIDYDQPTIQVGETPVGGSKEGPQIKVFNRSSDQPLRVSAFVAHTLRFLISPNRFTVPPGGVESFKIRFLPDWSGTYEGLLKIAGENDSGFRVIKLPIFAKANGDPPRMRIGVPLIEFPETRVGGESTKSIRIHNDGNGALFVKHVDFGLDRNGVFSASSRQLVIPAHEDRPLRIIFKPIAAQNYQSQLCIVTNDPRIGEENGCDILRTVGGGSISFGSASYSCDGSG